MAQTACISHWFCQGDVGHTTSGLLDACYLLFFALRVPFYEGTGHMPVVLFAPFISPSNIMRPFETEQVSKHFEILSQEPLGPQPLWELASAHEHCLLVAIYSPGHISLIRPFPATATGSI